MVGIICCVYNTNYEFVSLVVLGGRTPNVVAE